MSYIELLKLSTRPSNLRWWNSGLRRSSWLSINEDFWRFKFNL